MVGGMVLTVSTRIRFPGTAENARRFPTGSSLFLFMTFTACVSVGVVDFLRVLRSRELISRLITLGDFMTGDGEPSIVYEYNENSR